MKHHWCNRSSTIPFPYFCLCITEAQFKGVLKHLKVTEQIDWIKNAHSDGTTHFFENKGKTSIAVCMRLKKGLTIEQIYGLLVHEAVHIWQDIRDSIGEKSPSKEFEAYTVQHIAQELFLAYKKLK